MSRDVFTTPATDLTHTFQELYDHNDITLQFTLEGTGAISGTCTWYHSIDGRGWAVLATQTVSGVGTTPPSELVKINTAAHLVRSVVSALVGTVTFVTTSVAI